MGDTIHVRGEGGVVIEMALPLHEAIADRLTKGHLLRVNPDGSDYAGDDDSVPGLPTEKPPVSALKPEWVGWAVAQGMKPDDAEAATKQDLIEKYGV